MVMRNNWKAAEMLAMDAKSYLKKFYPQNNKSSEIQATHSKPAREWNINKSIHINLTLALEFGVKKLHFPRHLFSLVWSYDKVSIK